MANGQLPEDGPARIGSIELPTGKVIRGYRVERPVAWATAKPVPRSGQVWDALSQLQPQTGLVPILLDGMDGDPARPWDDEDFVPAEDPRMADDIDVASELSNMWWPPQGHEPHELVVPFTRFPGLAPAETEPLTPAERRAALGKVLPGIRERRGGTKNARIGLVAADRAADMLAVVGWGGLANQGESLLTLTAILRSWEDRFGARVIDVGYADLRLFVERPPRTLEAAQRVAAEHVFLASDCLDGCRSIPDLAPLLVNAPIWTFWWD
jgi:hypothetical protein